MHTLQGTYNTAQVMTDSIDDGTREQILSFLNHPAFADTYIAIMPDCHVGMGAVIGLTMKANSYVIPNIIGEDIGCGMLTARLPRTDADFRKLDEAIKLNIPSGFAINQKSVADAHTAREVANVCRMIGIDAKRALKAIGSLGGGNHFIEAGYDSENRLVVTVHSGSRNFGKSIADFYQAKAKEGLARYFLQGQYRNLEFLPVESDEGQDYLYAMGVAQSFASLNRKEIMNRIFQYFRCEPLELIESVHNFIGDDNVIRKGATPARLGEKVIIPFNMAEGIASCVGKGSAQYNNSAPHGAGRIMSRNQAKRTLSVEAFSERMRAAGVYTTTATEKTLDEAPDAYKSRDLILDNIKDTVEVTEFIKPAYNFKAGAD